MPVMLIWGGGHDYVCGAFVISYKNAAYYGIYATIDSTLLNGHCGHIVQWYIINYLKSIGIEVYETGDNYYKENILSDNDKKLYAIAKYKKGFRTFECPKITYFKKYENGDSL